MILLLLVGGLRDEFLVTVVTTPEGAVLTSYRIDDTFVGTEAHTLGLEGVEGSLDGGNT